MEPDQDQRNVGTVRQPGDAPRVDRKLSCAIGEPGVDGLAVLNGCQRLVGEALTRGVNAPLESGLARERRVWVWDIHAGSSEICCHKVAQHFTVGRRRHAWILEAVVSVATDLVEACCLHRSTH
jgi:hypothetical protein